MSILLRMYPGDAWGFLIANVLVQVTVVIFAARLLARLGGRWNAAWRHSIYSVALICVLASPVLSWVMQVTGIAMVTLRPSVPIAPPAEPEPTPVTHIRPSSLIETPTTPPVAASSENLEPESFRRDLLPGNPSAPSFPDLLRALGGGAMVIWPLGMALLLARWCHGLCLVARLRRTAQPLDCMPMAGLLQKVRQVLGAAKLPPMATSEGLDLPVMVGLVRPLVILPENVQQTLDEQKLADVLVHECAHAVCRHQVVGLLQRLAALLFWPHPLVHLLNRELSRAREEVCDNYVIRRGDAPRYARTLLELSELLVGVSPKPAALGLFHCRWRLEDRIAGLLDRRRKTMTGVNRWTVGLSAILLLAIAGFVASMRVARAGPEEQPKPAASAPTAKERPGKHAAETVTLTRTNYERRYSKDGKRTWLVKSRTTIAYLDPGFWRTTWYDQEGKMQWVEITDATNNKTLHLEMKSKKAIWMVYPHMQVRGKPVERYGESLKRNSIQWVGQRDVNGRTANVFRDHYSGDPKTSFDVWIDAESKQVVGRSEPGADVFDPRTLADRDNPAEKQVSKGTILGTISDNIVFDAPLDAKLFSLTPPEGFEVVQQRRFPPVTEAEMIEWLGVTARFNNGVFVDTPKGIDHEKHNEAARKKKAERTDVEQRFLDLWSKHVVNVIAIRSGTFLMSTRSVVRSNTWAKE